MTDMWAPEGSGGVSREPGITQLKEPYKFSPEELRVMKECNQESFYQRSVPISSVFGLGTYIGINFGYLKPNSRFGAAPKVAVAVIMGYFLGKLSYQQKCAEKLMALPNSYIGQLLRDRRNGIVTPPPSQSSSVPMFGATSSDIYSDAGPGSSLNLDTDRPRYDQDAFNGDNGTQPPSDVSPSRSILSYDDLRKSNREVYNDKRQDPYSIDPSNVPPITRSRPVKPPSSSTNKYGDTME